MKRLILSLALALPAVAGEIWFELRSGETSGPTNYFVPAGRVVQVVDYTAKGGSMTAFLERPEGRGFDIPVGLNAPQVYLMGPATLKMIWFGAVDSRINFNVALCREFDAIPAPVAVNLHLEASTNLNGGMLPAATFFRAKSAP